jgi:hypothetical protein
MVDALVSGTSVRKDVEVQVLSSAPHVMYTIEKSGTVVSDFYFTKTY